MARQMWLFNHRLFSFVAAACRFTVVVITCYTNTHTTYTICITTTTTLLYVWPIFKFYHVLSFSCVALFVLLKSLRVRYADKHSDIISLPRQVLTFFSVFTVFAICASYFQLIASRSSVTRVSNKCWRKRLFYRSCARGCLSKIILDDWLCAESQPLSLV